MLPWCPGTEMHQGKKAPLGGLGAGGGFGASTPVWLVVRAILGYPCTEQTLKGAVLGVFRIS